MLGAIFGDIVGSAYEHHNTKRMDFPLLSEWSRPTDDTIMTLAVADALMNTWKKGDMEIRAELVKSMQQMGRRYPYAGYGGRFRGWIAAENPRPYNSLGNGSGMRVSPVGWLYHTLDDTLRVAKLTAEVSHNHPEGIKGAQAIAACVFLARAGASKEEIRKYIEDTFEYDLSKSLDNIRGSYYFNPTCPGSVPEAIRAFYEGKNYEDVIRRAVSLGGDSDTIACMAGAVAEAYFGMPEDLKMKALHFLDPYCRGIMEHFREFCHTHDRTIEKEKEGGRPVTNYRSLFTKHLDELDIKYTEIEDNMVKLTISKENQGAIPVLLTFNEGKVPNVSLRSYILAGFAGEKRVAGILACNELNSRLRWGRFSIQDESKVDVEMDACIDEKNVGSVCLFLAGLVMPSIIEAAYPAIMKALWK